MIGVSVPAAAGFGLFYTGFDVFQALGDLNAGASVRVFARFEDPDGIWKLIEAERELHELRVVDAVFDVEGYWKNFVLENASSLLGVIFLQAVEKAFFVCQVMILIHFSVYFGLRAI